MPMPLKLKHEYHDGIITEVRFRDDRDVIVFVRLCSWGNQSSGPATISFIQVKNFQQVYQAFESVMEQHPEREYVDHVFGIVRNKDRSYELQCINAGCIRIEAVSILET